MRLTDRLHETQVILLTPELMKPILAILRGFNYIESYINRSYVVGETTPVEESESAVAGGQVGELLLLGSS